MNYFVILQAKTDESKYESDTKSKLRNETGHYPGHGRIGRRTGKCVAFPLYDRPERWCCLYHHLCCMRADAGHPLYAQRVYHRTQGTGQHGTGLLETGQRHPVATDWHLRRVYRFPDYRLLCGGVGLVSAVYLCLGGWSSERRRFLREDLFRDILVAPLEACGVDAGVHAFMSFHHLKRCGEGY